jgi:hypothetical protein
MKNYKDKMTGLRAAIFDAKLTQAQLAAEAGVTENSVSLAASGRMTLGTQSGEKIREALARRGVVVTLDVARGL